MRLFYTLFFILLLGIQFPSYSQWEWLHPKPAGVAWRKVHFVNNQTGFAVGGGQIIRTDDNGGNWKTIQKMSSTTDMDFEDSLGIVVGHFGTVYRTTNLGNSWQPLSIGIYGNFDKVFIVSRDTIFFVNLEGKIYRTYDGAKSWKTFNIAQKIYSIDFISGTVGFIGGRDGVILKTVDGGENWTFSHDQVNFFPSEVSLIDFVNENIGFAFRGHDDLLKTTDGGRTWLEISNISDNMYSSHFLDENNGFMAGEHGAMWKTADGGLTWNWIGDGRIWNNDIRSIYFTSPTTGFALGNRGRILKTTDGGKTWQPYTSTYNDILGLAFPTPAIGYAITWNKILKTTDGGNTWNILPFTPNDGTNPYNYSGFRVCKFFDQNTGIIGGNWAVFYKTYDGGQTWKKIELNRKPLHPNIESMFFLNDKIGFASGDYDGLDDFFSKTTDGGETWTVLAGKSLSDIFFLNEQIGFGYIYDILYKTDDGGNNWHQTPRATDEWIKSIRFVDDKIGFLACENGIIEKTVDGGLTWSSMKVNNQYYSDLLSLKFFDKTIGYLTAEDNSIFKTVDGGNTWQRDSYSFYNCKHIEFTNDYSIYLGGMNACIQRKTMDIGKHTIEKLSIKNISDSSAAFSTSITVSYGSVDSIKFEYGINNYNSYLKASPERIFDKTDTVKATALNLQPNTKYWVRVSLYLGGKTYYGPPTSFTTLPKIEKYKIENLQAKAITDSSATISAFFKVPATIASSIVVEYGTAEFNSTITAIPGSVSNGEDTIKAILTSLNPITTYKSRLKFFVEGETYYSDEITFITSPKSVMIETVTEKLVTDSSTILLGVISVSNNTATNIAFEYGKSTFDHTIDGTPGSVTNKTDTITAIITGLEANTVYKARMKYLVNGNTKLSEEFSFTTLSKNTPTGMEEVDPSAFTVFPNPTDGIIYITYKAGMKHISFLEIMDATGKSLLKTREMTANMSSFPAGFYILKASDGKNIYLKKLIKN